MKLRLELLSITAASVLAFGTALAADDAAQPAEPQDQAGASMDSGQSPATAGTVAPPPGGDDDGQTAAAGEAEPASEPGAVGGGAAGGAVTSPAEPQGQIPESLGPGTNPPEEAEVRDLSPDRADADQGSDAAVGGGEAGGSMEPMEEAGTGVDTGEPQSADTAGAASDDASQGMGAAAGAGSQYDQETIRQVQQALNDRGHDSGQVDGIIGPNTRDALRAFQQEEGMPASGELDEETLSALGVQSSQG